MFTSLYLPSISLALGTRLPRFLLRVFRLLGDGVTGGGEQGGLVLVEGGVGVVVVRREGGLEHGQGVGQGDTGSLSKHSHPTVALLGVGVVVDLVGDVDGGDGDDGPLCGVTCCVLKVEMLLSSSYQRLSGGERTSQPSRLQHNSPQLG